MRLIQQIEKTSSQNIHKSSLSDTEKTELGKHD